MHVCGEMLVKDGKYREARLLSEFQTLRYYKAVTHHLMIIQVATFIVQKILMNDDGLSYCCIIADRLFAITNALETMMERLSEEPSQRLLKHIIYCYLKLSKSPRLAKSSPGG